MPAADATREPPPPRVWLYLTPPVLLLALYLVGANLLGWNDPDDTPPIPGTTPSEPLGDAGLAEVGALVKAAASGQTPPAITAKRLGDENHGVYVALRATGVLVAAGWNDQGTVGESLAALVAELARRSSGRPFDAVEICLSHSFREVEGRRRQLLSNIYRGVRGLEIDTAADPVRVSPTEMIARNVTFRKVLDEYARSAKISVRDVSDAQLRVFDCDQLLVDLPAGKATAMFRGNTVIPTAAVDRALTQKLAAGMANWLVTHVHEDGRMTYKWWPSRGVESQANNMIRQWMATVALVRHGVRTKNPTVLELAARNIDYNLKAFYRENGAGQGMILYNRKAKLGAAALAAMAILEHPDRQRWARFEQKLTETIFFLQRDSGEFRTFLVPEGRNDVQNFYPGEALYYLALKYKKDRTPELAERIMRGFKYYRRWHRENRNPAFIPWHVQAYYNLWTENKNRELADFVFEMSDFIAGFQQWDTAVFPDAVGRFYDPKRRRFGPPHASSTGVYLEGLIDAYKMAKALGDETRVQRYRRAIVGGIRSQAQLQFADDIDMYYISKRDLVRGGMRTTVYDNGIRVDNVQHGFMGIMKILDEFSDDDYARGRE